MHRSWWKVSWLSGLAGLLVSGGLTEDRKQNLCPEVVASLSKIPSNANWNTTAQRVEIRRCSLHFAPGAGRLQLAAWRKDDLEPALVFDPELYDGLVQMLMIEGVYVFQFMGGLVSPVVVIVFENGNPRIALHDSTRGETTISSDGEKVAVAFADQPGLKRRYEFHRSDSGARRGSMVSDVPR